MILSQSNVSKVELIDGFVYKTQPKFLTDNEIYCFDILAYTGYVPEAEQISIDCIRLEYIKTTPITDINKVAMHFSKILELLDEWGIRHGDLTEKNILIKNNHPYLIDFSESRLACDPRPDKRREGDNYWLNKTLEGYEKFV